MIEIRFTKTSVAVYAEGKLFSRHTLSKNTYWRLWDDLEDSTYPTYVVTEHGEEIFRGTSWWITQGFLRKFLGQ